ncbi:MAG TPA: choice-of-anchor tandem repeat GloVer-containing protein [Terracidiphilus sp.]|nr:choice-of-anchor tandem repeat GloVer-containing protein [Terracidiphilus sp.]
MPLLLAGALALTVTTVSAQTLTPLYSFTGGSDGSFPYGSLVVDASGNLYGTTYGGGGSVKCGGCGVVFKVTPAGAESVLYSFSGFSTGDGQNPLAGLVMSPSGNLFGTTSAGGSGGTVFEVTPTGTETVLFPFSGGGSGGAFPAAGVIMDASGNLYGTTEFGGASGFGTVFKLTPAGAETVLYSFAGGGDGGFPSAGLVMDAAGNLYGTTSNGGNLSGCSASGCGVVFKVTPSGTESVLYTFSGGGDGGTPFAGLIMDSAGNVYGTTSAGGNLTGCAGGCGVVFKVTPAGSESVLYTFTGGSDGANPAAGLLMDASGILYGTTSVAGADGFGTVFKVTSAGAETTLHTFTSGADGANPQDALVADASGNLYGTASQGGNLSDCHGFGCGAVFKLSGTGFSVPSTRFAGTPGKPDCLGVSVFTLAKTYGGIDHAARSLKYPSVNALLEAVWDYCSESKKDCGGGSHSK